MFILFTLGGFLIFLPLLFALLSGNTFVLVGAGIGVLIGILPPLLLLSFVSVERFHQRQIERTSKQAGALIGLAAGAGTVLSPFIPFSKLPPPLLWGVVAASGAFLMSFSLAMHFKFERGNG